MRTNSLKNIVIAALASVATASAVHAQVIGIDLVNGAGTQSPASTDVVGPYASAGWNNQFDVGAVPGPISLVDNSGNTVAGSATFGFTQGGNALNGNPIYN